MVQEETSFKYITYLELWQPFFQRSETICALGRGHHEEQFCETFEFGQAVQEEIKILLI